MSRAAPRVSVVVATFRSGDALNRLVDSLDAQTLPADEFELVLVDDGSPDDTFDRLQRLAATRPNVQALRVEHSGWPSRPRNVGIEHARGEYVLFMDHDDTLYPDALRSAYAYATAHSSDVLSPKESKTNDAWWAIPLEREPPANVANTFADGGISRISPLVPHKLYRRQLLLDHKIRFPEGGRVLWEDWFFNVAAYRHARVVSTLADCPFYLWQDSDSNSSWTFNPATAEYWDRLDDLLRYITKTFRGRAWRGTRAWALSHHVRERAVDRCVRLLARPERRLEDAQREAFRRAQAILRRYASDDVVALLPRRQQILVHLMRGGDAALCTAFHAADLALTSDVTLTAARWTAPGILELEARLCWRPTDPRRPAFRPDGERFLRVLGPKLEAALPPELLDYTAAADNGVWQLAVRSRAEHVTWVLPVGADPPSFEANRFAVWTIAQPARATIDLSRSALGRPLAAGVWDLHARTRLYGRSRRPDVQYGGAALPTVWAGGSGVAYANSHGALSLDLAQQLRTVAIDAKPRTGPAGPVTAFHAPLDNITAFGPADLDAGQLVAIPTTQLPDDTPEPDHTTAVEQLAPAGDLHARIVVTPTDGATLHGGAPLPPGDYRLYARRAGTLRRTACSIVVDNTGQLRFT